jgi:oxygen-independent coproporphyrinogen-3 oxidase
MWPYHPDLLETPVPRYTSYPTAAEFSGEVGQPDLASGLDRVTGPVSLYLHIPFCEKICWYCGCNTSAANRRDRLESYLIALEREIALVGARLGGKAKVSRVSFGGGSPNAISTTDFVRLVNALTMHFDVSDPAWSVEIDPRTLTADWGLVLGFVGVERASFGVQTFSPRLQAAIGREQGADLIERGVAILRGAGVTSLNFDLMYGLPGQTLAELEDSLVRSAALGADRIALFGYAHVPHMIPRQRRIDGAALPDQHERFAMAAFGYEFLLDAGYRPIGFDHFARPGDPLAQAAAAGTLHRNFQGFTDDSATELIGLGASAISCFPSVIVQNEKNAGRYRMLLSQGVLPASLGVRRSGEDQLRGALIESLLCQGRARLDPALAAGVRAHLAPFIERGLARFGEGELHILPGGLPYARAIAATLDPYRKISPRQFSSAI